MTKDLMAPPTQEELDLMAPPSEEELDLMAPPSEEELTLEGIREDLESNTVPRFAQAVALKEGAKAADLEGKVSKIGSAISDTKLGKATGGAVRGVLAKTGKFDADELGTISKNLEKFQEYSDKPGKAGAKALDVLDRALDESYNLTKTLDVAADADEYNPKASELLENVEARTSSEILGQTEETKSFLQSGDTIKDTERRIKKVENAYNKKLTELLNKKEEYDTLSKEYKSNKDGLRVAKEMKDAESQALSKQLDDIQSRKRKLEKEILEYKKAGGSKDAVLQMQDEIKDLDIAADELKVQKRKVGENLTNMIHDARKEREKSLKLSKEYAEKKKEVESSIKTLEKNNKDNLKVLQDKLKNAKKVRESNKLSNIPKSSQDAFEELQGLLKKERKLDGDTLNKMRKYFSKEYGYSHPVTRAIIDEIKKGSPKSKALLDQAHAYINNEEELTKLFPTKKRTVVDPKTGLKETFRTMDKGASQKFADIMTQEAGGERFSEKQFLDDVFKKMDAGEVMDDLEINKLARLAEADADFVDAYFASKGLSPSSFKRIISDIGTYFQSKGAKLMGTPLGKSLGKVAKGLGMALPVVGFVSDYMEADDLGIADEYGTSGKAVYAAAEAFNPTPVSSGDVYKATRAAERHSPETFIAAQAAKKALPALEGLYNVFKGLDEKKQVKEITKLSENRENVGQLIKEMRKVDDDFAEQIQNIQNTAKSDDDFKRKMSVLNSDPAYRELVRRRMRRIGNEQSDRDED